MQSIEVLSRKLEELGNFHNLVPALEEQMRFLDKRKRMLEQDLINPDGLLSSMAYEMAETFKPRAQYESNYWSGDHQIEIREDLASESADIVIFGLSALMAREEWSNNDLNLISDSLKYANELADIGEFDLNEETIRKIREVNEKHYPEIFFEEPMEYQMSRRVCRSLRHYFGSEFWDKLGREQIGSFLRDVSESPNGSVPSNWIVNGQLDEEEYSKFKVAAQQIVGVFLVR